MNQRFIIYLAAIFQDKDIKFFLQDITSAYVKSTSYFNKKFCIWLLLQLIESLNTKLLYILKLMKPLYDVPEAQNHWFVTYHSHPINKEDMK